LNKNTREENKMENNENHGGAFGIGNPILLLPNTL